MESSTIFNKDVLCEPKKHKQRRRKSKKLNLDRHLGSAYIIAKRTLKSLEKP
jgi:hypothetical protein